MDLIDWRVENKHRKDLVKLKPNYRKQSYVDLLPRDERPYHLYNAAHKMAVEVMVIKRISHIYNYYPIGLVDLQEKFIL